MTSVAHPSPHSSFRRHPYKPHDTLCHSNSPPSTTDNNHHLTPSFAGTHTHTHHTHTLVFQRRDREREQTERDRRRRRWRLPPSDIDDNEDREKGGGDCYSGDGSRAAVCGGGCVRRR
ncbi:hypothetical protein HanPI659440_Chr11g0421261 [Helianthus annuus]|nr:hypothetical protein HanPI659440_Chr11g0421261 [Helianthus annuus]